MKIDFNVISLPPHISTSWKNVDSIFLENDSTLVILLKNGTSIKIPSLDKSTIELIFTTHTKVLEMQAKTQAPTLQNNPLSSFNFPIKIDDNGIEAMGMALSHNPSQVNAPILPEEVLKKISMIAKILGSEIPDNKFPVPENGCNCPHCQIARAIHKSINPAFEENSEEEVSEEDLKFTEWDIKSVGNKVYLVTDPLTKEEYRVFLGEPLGCTCGEKNCEHIRAVLKS
jgi:hypothetical protein